jgi:hypothetical protein
VPCDDIFGEHMMGPEEITKVPFTSLALFIARSGRFIADREGH